MRALVGLAAVLTLVGCGTIERTATPQQSLGKTLLAGPGDVVLRVDRERSLENAFGKADVFGRSTKEGFSEVRFAGVEPSGVVGLCRKDMSILTNETTMTRTPTSITSRSATTTTSGTINQFGNTASINAASQTSGTSTTVSSGKDYHIAGPSDTVPIRLAPDERRVPMAGLLIEGISATPNSIEYRLIPQ